MIPEEASLQPPVRTARVGAVAVVTLTRPEVRNALSPQLMSALAEALEQADADNTVGCVVIEGSERVFAAGGDLKWMRDQGREGLLRFGAGDWPRIRAIGVPTIAAVSGLALGGGCELALSCDMIVASETATFGQPEILLGLIPGAGGTQRLSHLLGRQRAMELVLTGRRIDAREALEMGIVNRVVSVERLREEALTLAAEVASRPRHAARLAKRAVRAAERMGLDAGLDHERRLFEQARATDDCEEGIDAFLSKRPSQFASVRETREDSASA
ncbi:enoyl-CoA hydratase-related protein [Conexibacter stalactiti]|uniref:Enoyl-CoA hydratase-related protein n=1 Tax=Conexibacter stalactiti TaxID=1940611 RepID=A0ABU4HLW3_9ACTN|nr:enoyl-CoA hydratase-related protein [Conexibacter stalactiti]MDW5593029.1 enoyl-CoA hydratase-related protein [Conexibacter stalactiti]MEC5033670.1 enoyl-CoA hydratase-related protein [Conexibacter stalactiti]